MKVIVSRVKEASVTVKNKLINKIDQGLLLLVGFTNDDTLEDLDNITKKILNLRIFDDLSGIMNLSIKDIKGSILSISQFTLYANTKNGNRPSYKEALKKEEAINLYQQFNKILNEDINTKSGMFGEEMQISAIHDGPVTIILDSKK